MKYKVRNVEHEFDFLGGVIIVSNIELSGQNINLRRLEALESRLRICELNPEREEILALMRRISLGGYVAGATTLTPEQCFEVADLIDHHAPSLQRPLTLRDLVDIFNDYVQQIENQNMGTPWQESAIKLLSRKVERASKELTHAKTQIKIEIAKEIALDPNLQGDQKLEEWKRRTGLERSSYYRAIERLSLEDRIAIYGIMTS